MRCRAKENRMTLLLALLFPFAIQYERGGWWRVLAPITLLTVIVDVAANYTELALLTWDHPRPGEHTFSQRLYRLQFNTDWRGSLARPIVDALNYFAPIQHIKNDLGRLDANT